jgi:hypothetical protein
MDVHTWRVYVPVAVSVIESVCVNRSRKPGINCIENEKIINGTGMYTAVINPPVSFQRVDRVINVEILGGNVNRVSAGSNIIKWTGINDVKVKRGLCLAIK